MFGLIGKEYIIHYELLSNGQTLYTDRSVASAIRPFEESNRQATASFDVKERYCVSSVQPQTTNMYSDSSGALRARLDRSYATT